MPSSSSSSSTDSPSLPASGILVKRKDANHLDAPAKKVEIDDVPIEIEPRQAVSFRKSPSENWVKNGIFQEIFSPVNTPEFGRAMYKYAKKMGKHSNHKEIPESKSDGNIPNSDNLVSFSIVLGAKYGKFRRFRWEVACQAAKANQTSANRTGSNVARDSALRTSTNSKTTPAIWFRTVSNQPLH